VHCLEEDENIGESIQDSNMQFQLEENDTITAIAISKDSRFLIANTSLKNPRI